MVDAIRPTIGPLTRYVAFSQLVTNKQPELLSKGGVIARRVIQLEDADEDMGAMIVRHLLCTLHDRYGDGTATAAMLFQAVFNAGVKYVVSSGINAMRLRHFLEQGMQVIVDELDRMTVEVDGKDELTRIAEKVCYDPALAEMLGEIIDIVGEHGLLEVRNLRGRGLKREYREGMYWEARPFSRDMIDMASRSMELTNAAVLITDLEIEDPQELIPALTAASEAGFKALLITATKIAPGAVGLLMANQDPEKFTVLAMRTPGPLPDDEIAAMEDLAFLTGGRRFIRATQDTLENVRPEDFGRARRVWATYDRLGIIGGEGDPHALRQHIKDLRAVLAREEGKVARQKLQERIGKLMGGLAILWIGSVSRADMDARKDLAQKTAEVLRGVLRDGVVPGGGVALLDCRPALERRLEESADPDEHAAYRILIEAMEGPARAIARNAGYDDSEIMAYVNTAGPGHGFDAVAGEVTDMMQKSIVDVAAVQKAAVSRAISTAAMTLTVDVLIHHRFPEEVLSGTA
jgi:chaperonin GroEL